MLRVNPVPTTPSSNPFRNATTALDNAGDRVITRTTTQYAIDPRTGAEMRYGPAMADKAVGIELPGLRQLFADIQR